MNMNGERLNNKKGIARCKRINEHMAMVPGFKEAYEADKEETLLKYGLSNVTEADKRSYEEFMKRKVEFRDRHIARCAPLNSKMRTWRERQKGRCMLSFPDGAIGNIQAPFTFELSSGCSVGCEFCGVGAKGLKSVFRYNEENAKLFRDVIQISKDIAGDALTRSALYFATEPLDNPDYERFRDIFANMNGQIPQITTAVPLRDIERTRRFVTEIDENSDMIHRFSVRSLEDFYKIMESFTEEELLFTELLPQYSEAPANNFVKAGRNIDADAVKTSISCISGFIVNMCERSVTLTTPIIPNKDYPEGMIILSYERFNTIDEYEDILNKAISGLKTVIDPGEKLRLNPDIELKELEEEDKIGFISKNGMGMVIDRTENDAVYSYIYDALNEGCYTRKEIGEIVAQKMGLMTPISIFTIINKLWKFGYIYDESIFRLKKE